jgi:hypothetical protein
MVAKATKAKPTIVLFKAKVKATPARCYEVVFKRVPLKETIAARLDIKRRLCRVKVCIYSFGLEFMGQGRLDSQV